MREDGGKGVPPSEAALSPTHRILSRWGRGESGGGRGGYYDKKQQKEVKAMIEIKFSRRNSLYERRQIIEIKDYTVKYYTMTAKDYEILKAILTSLRESTDLEVIILELPGVYYEVELKMRNSKYYIHLCLHQELFDELWKTIATREREITELFLIKLLHFSSKFKWGRVEEKSSCVIEISDEVSSC
jgi:hypothetical protein